MDMTVKIILLVIDAAVFALRICVGGLSITCLRSDRRQPAEVDDRFSSTKATYPTTLLRPLAARLTLLDADCIDTKDASSG
jgi:hypothetical protein